MGHPRTLLEKWRLVSINNKLIVIFTGVTTFATMVYCIVTGWTLIEIHSSGLDTHNLAISAANQATWTQRLSDNTKTQSDRTKDLADRMQDQADRTKTIADQAIIQAHAAQDAVALTQKQLSASEGAIVTLIPDWQETLHAGINTIVISLANRGHATPKRIHGELKVIRETIPDEAQVPSADLPLVVDRDFVIPTPGNEYGQRITYPISVSSQEFNAIEEMRMTISLRGTLRYWNGFEDIKEPMCFDYLDLIFKDKSGVVVSNGQPGFRPCAEYDSNIRIWVNTKHEWESRDWREIQGPKYPSKPN
jgi:hypothetical protein